MESDLLKAVAKGESWRHFFPGGFVRLNRLFVPEMRWKDANAHSPVYIEGSFTTNAPPAVEEAFGIQRYVSALCGLAIIKRVGVKVGEPFVVEFESVGPVFGDTSVN